MHCDVIRPALPIAGFLVVFGLTVLAAQLRGTRDLARVALGVGSLLVAALAFTSVPSVGCDVPSTPPTPRSAAAPLAGGGGR